MMDPNGPEALSYLAELYQLTAGDVNSQVSMYDVGAALNLEKTASGKLAEDLIGEGLVEVKTLSGGIGITALGIERVQGTGHAGNGTADGLALGKGPVLEAEGKEAADAILQQIKTALSKESPSYDRIEELVIDIKTIEVQLLSPKPKTAIVREVLRSVGKTLRPSGRADLVDTIEKMVAD